MEDDLRLHDLLGSVLRPDGWRPILTSSAAEALACLEGGRDVPEVAIVDLGLPDMDGVGLIDRIGSERPGLPIVVLTVCTARARILDALRHGARGYLFKDDLNRGLGPALEEAAAGGAPMSRAVARLVLEQVRGDQAAQLRESEAVSLTPGERRVVEQLARGLSYNQVAGVLEISTNTVRNYVRAIYEKLCVSSKTEAVLAAMRLRLIEPPTD